MEFSANSFAEFDSPSFSEANLIQFLISIPFRSCVSSSISRTNWVADLPFFCTLMKSNFF